LREKNVFGACDKSIVGTFELDLYDRSASFELDLYDRIRSILVRPARRGLIMMISNWVSGSRLLRCVVYSVGRAFTRF